LNTTTCAAPVILLPINRPQPDTAPTFADAIASHTVITMRIYLSGWVRMAFADEERAEWTRVFHMADDGSHELEVAEVRSS
jgi:hypothetical protein